MSDLESSLLSLEVLEKIGKCNLMWNRVPPNQFRAQTLVGADIWLFLLNRLAGKCLLDVYKNEQYFHSIDSTTDDYIDSLYDDLMQDKTGLDETLELLLQIKGKCIVYLEEGHGGVICSGENINNTRANMFGSGGILCGGHGLHQVKKYLSPYHLTIIYEPTEDPSANPEPWVGSVTDINETTSIENNDGDAHYLELSKIPYQGSGVESGGVNLLLVAFDTSSLDLSTMPRKVICEINVAYSYKMWRQGLQDMFIQINECNLANDPDYQYQSLATGLIQNIWSNVADITAFPHQQNIALPDLLLGPHLLDPASGGSYGYKIETTTSVPTYKSRLNQNVVVELSAKTEFVVGRPYGFGTTGCNGEFLSIDEVADWQSVRITAVTFSIATEIE